MDSPSTHDIRRLLEKAANSPNLAHVICYPKGNLLSPSIASYHELWRQSQQISEIILSFQDFHERQPILLLLEDNWDMILWHWAVLLANGVPIPLCTLPNEAQQRQQRLQSVSTLLDSPICITRAVSLNTLSGTKGLRIKTVERCLGSSKDSRGQNRRNSLQETEYPDRQGVSNETAMLMLTSGSTRDAKAVELTHKQILTAVRGKASLRKTPNGKPFLNWVAMDHVASVVEIHFQALYLNIDQVHVHAEDVVSTPTLFLDLLNRHQVSRSFAPNFFLAKLVACTKQASKEHNSSRKEVKQWDLSNLTILASGGESNDIETCIAAAMLLEKYGAPPNVVVPGFGMTETCAGAIFNLHCPQADIAHNRAVASLGKCIPGIEMRVTAEATKEDVNTVLSSPNEVGNLEVRGDIVFRKYYHDTEATNNAFTLDKWFRTGDQAMFDTGGNLCLVGRAKEVFNVNGIKISCASVQAYVEKAIGEHVERVVAFPSRAPGHPTEQITIAFVPKRSASGPQHITQTSRKIIESTVLLTSSRPFVFSLIDESRIPKSTLGKVLASKMRRLFEGGDLDGDIARYNVAIESSLVTDKKFPATEMEQRLLDDVSFAIGQNAGQIGVETTFFEFGFTSIDLIRLKRCVDQRLQIDTPVVLLLKNPSVRRLASALEGLTSLHEVGTKSYDPVVVLRPEGAKSPLWLVHPGLGEVLVFVGLAQHLADDDRPVYALRARGFETSQTPFSSIRETVECYRNAIKRRQPMGPYAIAGYSYGAMLAFEVAKLIEKEDGEMAVRFLGSFNLPPHIKHRMRDLNRNLCLLHLTYFLGLIEEADANRMERELRDAGTGTESMILNAVREERMTELGLDREKLVNWGQLAYGLQSMAVDYEPEGNVGVIDVFHAIPLAEVAKSKEDWLENHLQKWGMFCRTEPRFHGVEGAHYTMIGPDYVVGFAKTLKLALRRRGI
ncbi:acyl-protein synthetase [Xylaria cf. heliscus]|nr:acyl-protein synthetase [Xylaria cf. heliscus]